jgi:FXSXX-COOH protein
MDTSGTPATPAISGVTDTRSLTLAQLAGDGGRIAAESLRRILPAGEEASLPMCGFQSSI